MLTLASGKLEGSFPWLDSFAFSPHYQCFGKEKSSLPARPTGPLPVGKCLPPPQVKTLFVLAIIKNLGVTQQI